MIGMSVSTRGTHRFLEWGVSVGGPAALSSSAISIPHSDASFARSWYLISSPRGTSTPSWRAFRSHQKLSPSAAMTSSASRSVRRHLIQTSDGRRHSRRHPKVGGAAWVDPLGLWSRGSRTTKCRRPSIARSCWVSASWGRVEWATWAPFSVGGCGKRVEAKPPLRIQVVRREVPRQRCASNDFHARIRTKTLGLRPLNLSPAAGQRRWLGSPVEAPASDQG